MVESNYYAHLEELKMNSDQSRKQLRVILLRLAVASVLLALSGLYLRQQLRLREDYTVTVVQPTCTASGYSLYTYEHTGATAVRDVVPALGHLLAEKEIIREGTELEPEIAEAHCSRCGESVQQATYPELGFPRLSLNGDMTGIGKKDEVKVVADFASGDIRFTVPATAKYQGHSTLAFDKKNYTLKLYQDEAREEKFNLEFSHWNPENKYILKANYQDPSQCRNLVAADIWADLVQSRASIPPGLEASSNFGAVDGFPVALYLNDTFYGLYTMNLHKDEDLYSMEEGEYHAVMIINHNDGGEAWFQAEAVFGEDTPWEVEFCGTEDDTWARQWLNALIRFVRDSDDETFVKELDTYLDIDAATDYVIAMYALGLQEHCAKDLVLVTYGDGEPWIASMYDMEEAFDRDGPQLKFSNGALEASTGSLLWDRFVKCFPEKIGQRYAELRKTVLEPETLRNRLTAFVGQIPPKVYQADAENHGYAAFDNTQTTEMNEAITEAINRMDMLLLNGGA